jgi:hypothetical protein
MHSLGLYGFPRRIFDYYIIFLRFYWLNAFGLVGIIVGLPFFITSLTSPLFLPRWAR